MADTELTPRGWRCAEHRVADVILTDPASEACDLCTIRRYERQRVAGRLEEIVGSDESWVRALRSLIKELRKEPPS